MQNRIGTPAGTASHPRRWPLILIALPAAVAIWSGWVGLAGMCGFGLVQPFPGIAAWHLDTRITLSVGVEAYAAYALGIWISPGDIPAAARAFARRSAVGSLLLGMGGQVVFHLLAAGHRTAAPWPVVMAVSCLPVAVLGFGAGLTHLLRLDGTEPEPSPDPAPETPPEQPEPVVPTAAETAARAALMATIRAGNPLSRNQLETRFRLTRAEATKLRAEYINEAAPERVRDSTTPAVPGALAAAGASQGHVPAASNGSAHA